MTAPNILVILADDLGYSDVGCYGSEIATPNIDRLARTGVRLNQLYNTARCSPSRASLLTGRHPHETGIGILTDDERPAGYPGSLSTEHPTIAERLKEAGYRTCLSGKWHLSANWTAPDETWPTRRGFDEFYGIISGTSDYFRPRALYRGEERLPVPRDDYYFTDAVTDHALEFLEDAGEAPAPFFLYLSYTAPHWPLHAREEDVRRYAGAYAEGWDVLRMRRLERLRQERLLGDEAVLSDRDPLSPAWDDAENQEWEQRRMEVYAAQVEAMDRGIGRVLDRLSALGVLDDTLVLFLSDNGACAEELPLADAPKFFERQPSHTVDGAPMKMGNKPWIMPGPEDTFASYGLPWANLSNTPFRLYKRWVHEGGIATPFVASWINGSLPCGEIVTTPFQLTDLVPTLLDAAGIALEREPGVSMLPHLRGGTAAARHLLFWEHIGNAAVRDGKWKAVRLEDEPWELYDMDTDRSELHNLAAENPEVTARLVAEWEAWARRVGVLDYPVRPKLYAARPPTNR